MKQLFSDSGQHAVWKGVPTRCSTDQFSAWAQYPNYGRENWQKMEQSNRVTWAEQAEVEGLRQLQQLETVKQGAEQEKALQRKRGLKSLWGRNPRSP